MNLATALTEVKKFTQFIKAFEHLQEVAEVLSKADQLVRESDQQRQQIDTAVQEQTDILGALERQIEAAKQLSDTIGADTEKRVDEMVRDATEAADHIRTQAEVVRDTTLEEFKTLREQCKQANDERDLLRSEHARISKEIAKVRDGIQAFVGDES